jgi:dimethylargininase
MTIAITRAVSPALDRCELTYLAREPLDPLKAAAEQRAYEACLAGLGLEVVSLPPEPDLPDSVFVEDPAVVVDEVAIMARMGAVSRRGESVSLAKALESYRPLRWITEPGTLEGGDVVRAGRRLLVGLSPRSNREGIRQLAELTRPCGYTVEAVGIRNCLHLKSACCPLGSGTLMVNREWVDPEPLRDFHLVDVPAAEPSAADVLTVGDTVLLPANFPETAAMLRRLGWKVQPLDVSELQKAEAGVTCLSILFEK